MISGQGTDANPDHGLALLTEVAETGDRGALYTLGDVYTRGGAIPVDGTKAVDYLTKSAEAGNSGAYTRLGEIYRDGIGVPVDAARAVSYFAQAQAAGSTSAGLRLAEAALWGLGEAQDVDKGLSLLRAAADGGDVSAKLTLSDVLLRGELVAPDVREGLKLLEEAAATGNATALTRLGNAYRGGGAIGKDPQKSLAFFEKAVAAGNASALLDLARGHMNGDFGRSSSQKLALGYARDAEARGLSGASVLMADWMLRGAGQRADVRGGLAKLEAAAKSGNGDAARRLIALYRSGSGKALSANPAKAQATLATYGGLLTPAQRTQEELLILGTAATSRGDLERLAEAFKAAPQATRINLLTTLRWSNANAFVYLVQDELKARGLYKGALNGLLTRDTIRAVTTLCDAGPSGERCRQGPLTGDAARLIAVRVATGA
jgi:hypothetical protein